MISEIGRGRTRTIGWYPRSSVFVRVPLPQHADVLGIFGREGLNLATLWAPPSPTDPGAFAFRMYRNYDGQGAAFGDTSVAASSADQGQLAIYAARRGGDGVLTLIIINCIRED
jgi:hypothetical protein